MKKATAIFLFLLPSTCTYAQLTFDISTIKKVEIEKIKKEKDSNIVYLKMKYGDHDIVNKVNFKKIENRILQKIQYVYTDHPKDLDLTKLHFQRFAALYAELPNIFNTSWTEWEVVKQTKCKNTSEAEKMFHGFVLYYKAGPEPNVIIPLPPHIEDKLKKIASTLEFEDIKSPDDLIRSIASNNVRITNVKYTNGTNSIKRFKQKELDGLNIKSGLFLTTGISKDAHGPNTSPSKTSVNSRDTAADPRLASIVGTARNLFDEAIVEFDLVADADSLVFNYAFASEEYPEYLQFNDAFGLFITGPALNNSSKDTTMNLATLPDNVTPVSVSSINHLKNKEYYISNDYDHDLTLFKTWQFDGFTKVLTARVKIRPQQKYHIRFAIADHGDPYYDSAIFIETLGAKQK